MHLFDSYGDRILTIQETAALLFHSPEEVLERAQRGGIPSFSVGPELMFSKTELERWILNLIESAKDVEQQQFEM